MHARPLQRGAALCGGGGARSSSTATSRGRCRPGLQPGHVAPLRSLACRSAADQGQRVQQPPAQLLQLQQQQQQQAAEANVRQLLTRRSHVPPHFVGPVKACLVPDKRFGLAATRNLAVGELLLVATPLVAAFGQAGAAPGNEQLVEQLQGQQLSPWQLQWLCALHRGDGSATASSSSSSVDSGAAEGSGSSAQANSGAGTPTPPAAEAGSSPEQQQASGAGAQGAVAAQPPAAAPGLMQEAADAEQQLLQQLQRLLAQGPDAGLQPSSPDAAPPGPPPPPAPAAAAAPAAPAAAAAAAEGASAGAPRVASVACPLSTEELQRVVAENAYCEAAEDLGAALLRELDPEAVAGLWPEYALLNHSCAPNTLALCVGRFLLLRATAPVLEGEELTCSYLGARHLGPIAARRAYLAGTYGFHCCCSRCLAEQRTFPTTYYVADDELLGLGGPPQLAAGAASGRGGPLAAAAGAARRLLGGQGEQQRSVASRPQPSPQHTLLLDLSRAVEQELRPAVQEAAAADSRRHERQLQLLAELTARVDAAAAATAAAAAGDPELQEQPATAARWLMAAVQPLLQLQVELLELLLASGGLPVDEAQQLIDEGLPGSSGARPGGSIASASSSSRAMAAAGAAAAARLSLSRRGFGGAPPRAAAAAGGGLHGWLSRAWASLRGAPAAAGGGGSGNGPVTKRLLLGLYAEALGRSAEVLDAVARGSEAHLVACIKHMDAVRRLAGAGAPDTALAEARCGRAHAARYGVQWGGEGRDTAALLPALISARRRRLLGQSLAKKMGVLAWESSLTRERAR